MLDSWYLKLQNWIKNWSFIKTYSKSDFSKSMTGKFAIGNFGLILKMTDKIMLGFKECVGLNKPETTLTKERNSWKGDLMSILTVNSNRSGQQWLWKIFLKLQFQNFQWRIFKKIASCDRKFEKNKSHLIID